jgi:outer membrane lipopolysaccharide assembly protein LptE/RlpB
MGDPQPDLRVAKVELRVSARRAKRRVARVSNFKLEILRLGSTLRKTLAAHWLLPTAFCLLSFACGYHVAGRGALLPPDVKTIAVPAFKNKSPTFRIEQRLTFAVTREFLERTRFRVTPNPDGADAVLKGTIKDVRAGVITFDLTTGRATSMQVQVTADVRLEDLHSHKVLFSNANYVFREEYEVSESPSALFEENEPALDRLSRDLARTLVTAILENF